MKPTSKSRTISAAKVMKLFAELGITITDGMERVRAIADSNSIMFYIPGGTVNITVNASEKGGAL